MKLYWKKQIINPYTIGVIIALPVILLLLIGFDTGMLPEFWYQMYPGESAAGDDLWIVSHVRHMVSFVDAMEYYISNGRHLTPVLASLAVFPFIQMREHFFPFARVRMKHPWKAERQYIVKSVLLAGGVTYCAYLLTMLVMRWWCVYTYDIDNCFDVFVNAWGWPLSAQEHPYFYVLALGALRYFCLPALMALLTVAISYLTDKMYIYLLVPTVYNLLASVLFSQGIHDRWPLPLFSPENMVWPSSPEYWSYGHNVHGIWGVVGASLFVIIPSVGMIWYGMRKRRA